MKLDYFKDTIFDLINETDTMEIKDILTNDKENTFTIVLMDGSRFELECRKIGCAIGWITTFQSIKDR